jgi:hypothetical protein
MLLSLLLGLKTTGFLKIPKFYRILARHTLETFGIDSNGQYKPACEVFLKRIRGVLNQTFDD